MNQMYNVILWGAGFRTLYYMNKGFFDNCNILSIVDSYSEKNEYLGYPVIKPEALPEVDSYDYIVVSNQFFFEIVVRLLELGVPLDKIIITDNIQEKPYYDCYERTKTVFPEIYNATKYMIKRTVKANERDHVDEKTIYNKNNGFSDIEYSHDYYRYRTMEFVAEMIESNNVEGALAELGVFRGVFSAVLNYRFPDKKLYLFDTFEGFDPDEAKNERDLGRCNDEFIQTYKDNSAEIMLKNIPHPEKAVICKGLFPDSVTAEAENEKFAFVSLDVDFEESTFEGLKFFYPRLSEGGYIFIHDYNTFYLDGVKIAVKRFEEYIGQKLKAVPIADRAGTLIIVK